MKDSIVLVAGGTAGHINAALSLGEVFKKKYQTEYITGTRYLDYQLFKDLKTIHLASRPLRTKNPITLLVNTFKNSIVFISLLGRFLLKRPRFIVGAGGYVCGPTLLAGFILGIPVYIIEQNAVMGMTNKILSKISKKIFVNFKETKGLTDKANVVVSGNPVRSKIVYNPPRVVEDCIHVLVFGGSLGATQINDAVKILIKKDVRKKIYIKHQVGKGNIDKETNQSKDITYEQYEYIEDMSESYKWSDIIIARAGASTISELRIVKKPSVLIPYPAATDNHQYYNALNLKKENRFYVEVIDNKLKNEELAEMLRLQIESINKSFGSVRNDFFSGNEKNEGNAAKTIKKVIEEDVWNK